MSELTYPRETIEFVALTMTDDTTPRTDFQVAITAYGTRPASWSANVTLGGEHGVIINGPSLGVGTFVIWGRIVGSPESPVVELGTFILT